MLIYLSLAKPGEVERFLMKMNSEFRKQNDDFQTRFNPIWQGLMGVIQGEGGNIGEIFLG